MLSQKGRTPSVADQHDAGPLFYSPTVVGVTKEMRMASEETFGPVAPIYRFDHEDEAVQLANDTPYGLAAYFYTEDLSRTFRVYEALDYGIIGVNTGLFQPRLHPSVALRSQGLGVKADLMESKNSRNQIWMYRNQVMSQDGLKRAAKAPKVMGDEFVDARSQVDELTMSIQDFVTRVAWDEIWNREALSDLDR